MNNVAKNRKIFFILSIFLFLIPVESKADTIISSPISTDTTWSPSGGVYLINSNFSVLAGATLTILPGTVIKGRSTAQGGPSIYGTLIAEGTSEAPIYFTTIYDDAIEGDSGNDGVTVGEPGGWQGLYFKP